MPMLYSFVQIFSTPVTIDWRIHFKGKPDYKSPFTALTALTWDYAYDAKIYRNRVVINLKNTVAVDKLHSWVKLDRIKDPNISAALLHHEQGHVNIQYILLLEADRVLKNNTYSVKNYNNEIANLARDISAYYDTMQRNYDEETEHGSNRVMQARWDEIIQEKIEESKAASSSLIAVK